MAGARSRRFGRRSVVLFGVHIAAVACRASDDAAPEGTADAGAMCRSRTPDAATWFYPESLPIGEPCSAGAVCEYSAYVHCPCPNDLGAPYNGYECTCPSGTWVCAVKYQGAGVCTYGQPGQPGCDAGVDAAAGGG